MGIPLRIKLSGVFKGHLCTLPTPTPRISRSWGSRLNMRRPFRDEMEQSQVAIKTRVISRVRFGSQSYQEASTSGLLRDLPAGKLRRGVIDYHHVTDLSHSLPVPHLAIPPPQNPAFCKRMNTATVRSLCKGANSLNAASVYRRAWSSTANISRLIPRSSSLVPASAVTTSPRPRCSQLCAWKSPALQRTGRGYASSSSTPKSTLKKTQLYDLHVAHKAKLVPFGGYSMPLQYEDLSHVESHRWTREKASLFDVSHMYVSFDAGGLFFSLVFF